MSLENKVQEQQFQGLPDWKVAEILNTPDENLTPVYKNINNTEIISVLIAYDKWVDIVKKSQGDLTVTENRLCKNVYDALALRRVDIDCTCEMMRTTLTNMLEDLVTSNIITQEIADLINSKAVRYPSWAEDNNIEITPRTVGIARGGIA